MRKRTESWQELVAPIVSKLQVGAAFGGDPKAVYFTRDGADALGKLLTQMAQRLDETIERENTHGKH